jgi:RimK family alpha-L-glutamate ligase
MDSDFVKKHILNESEKGMVFTFGRFSPPHAGHELLINKVLKVAKQHKFEHGIYASKSHDKTRNPLKYKDKIALMKKAFKGANVVNNPKLVNPFFVAKKLSDDGYKHVILVVGGDRVDEMDKNIRPYINHSDPNKSFNFETFKVVSAGKRDPDSSDVSGMSASKMRATAADGDFETFKSGVPSGMSDKDAQKMYNTIRKEMGIREEIESFFDSISLLGISEKKFVSLAKERLSEGALNYLNLNEQEDSKKPTLVVLSKYGDKDDQSNTIEKIEKSADKMGIDFYSISVDDAYVVDKDMSDNELVVHNYDGETNKVTLNTENTVCWPRGGVLTNFSGVGLLSVLQDSDIFCVNKLSNMELARNKYATAMLLEREQISSPRTALVSNEDAIDIALEKIGGEFPVVLKTLTGAEGIGVSIIESYESLVSVLQSLWKFDAEVIMQEYFEIEHDIRTIVLDNEIIASIKRIKGNKDFRTNKSLGSDTEPYELSEKEKSLILKTAKASGCYLCGVDHITVDEDDHKILEVNGSPGSGADEYSTYFGDEESGDGQTVVDYIVKYIIDKDNWKHSSKEIGVIEQIEIEGIGTLNARADTGNTGLNSLHAEDITINNGDVTFTTEFGKNITLPLDDTSKIKIDNDSERRPVVLFNIKMGKKSYKDVPFTLNDRHDMEYSVLLGQDFLKRANFSVNVRNKHELSEDEKKILNIEFNLLEA